MKFGKLSTPVKWTLLVVFALLIIGVSVGISVGVHFAIEHSKEGETNPDSSLDPPDPDSPLPPSQSSLGVYQKFAVTTNGPPCAQIGSDILAKQGNAVEAAIAALFCEGVVCLQSMGVGGGFLMTIYERSSGTATVLNARETAPAAASEDMFGGDSESAQTGGKAVAVPGELKGYWEAFQKYKSGKVSWKELIEPTIKLCEEGFTLNSYIAGILKSKRKEIFNSPTMREILINPVTNSTWAEGEKLKRPVLAKTLRVIADSPIGAEELYSGSLVNGFVQDIQDLEGIITVEDMRNYRVKWSEPVRAALKDGITMYSVPPPGSGVLLAFLFNILNGFIPTSDDVVTHQRIVETFKYGYGRRTELGDPDFVNITELVSNLTSPSYATEIRALISDTTTSQDPAHYGAVLAQPEDHGTAHVSVVAPNGDAVAVTSTINLILGAMVRSRSTGIILNNEMDDFSAPNITNGFGIPPSPANFIKPGKRPLSSMCPSVFVDNTGRVRLVVGAAGGTKITTATALVSMYSLWMEKNIKEAVDQYRFHHQLFPMAMQYEYGMTSPIVKGLSEVGHNTTRFTGGSSVTAIERQDGVLYANSDFRRQGRTAGS